MKAKFKVTREAIIKAVNEVFSAMPDYAKEDYFPDDDGNTYLSIEGFVDNVTEIIDNENLKIRRQEDLFELAFELF